MESYRAAAVSRLNARQNSRQQGQKLIDDRGRIDRGNRHFDRPGGKVGRNTSRDQEGRKNGIFDCSHVYILLSADCVFNSC